MSSDLCYNTPMPDLTVTVNRKLFWRRVFWVGGLYVAYITVMTAFFGLSIADATFALPALIAQGALQGLTVVALLGANFMLFFGPFLLFARMGKETYEPGDASWDTKISDVRGQKAAVAEMQLLLNLFHEGKMFVKAGGKREKGAIMVGPPGTGKTMLAKAIATELKMPIIVASGASFGGIFFGMDAVAVFMMMRTARKKAKRWGGCVIFIDEIDALAQSRGGMGGGGMMGGMGGMMGGSSMGLNMLLTQMDGVDSPGFFKKLFRRFINVTLDGLYVPRRFGRIAALRPPKYNLLFLGATNRPSVLDPAVTRPGRFGRQITFRNPTKQGRLDIADLYFSTKTHDAALDTPAKRDEFARITVGHSPAEIEQILSLALIYAFEEKRESFNWNDVRTAIANVESGLAEAVDYSDRDKIGVARHELGHAVAAKFYQPDKGMARLSIRMRGGSLGHFYATDKEEEFLKLRSQIRGDVVVCLGARAAEVVFYGENTAGVSMDLLMATHTVSNMIGAYGMGKELGLSKEEDEKSQAMGEYLISLAEAIQNPLAGSPVGTILQAYRKPVAQVLGKAYIDAWRLMYTNKDAIDKAAKVLMEKQEIVGVEIDALLDSVNLIPANTDLFPPDIPKIEKKKDGTLA
jgi:cell division protease FtsH